MMRTAIADLVENVHDYPRIEQLIRRRVLDAPRELYTVDHESLWLRWHRAIPANRGHYDCRACRQFIERFGGLVSIDEWGVQRSVLWDGTDVPEFFRPAFAALRDVVERAAVTGVYVSSETEWGTPSKGGWTHLAGVRGDRWTHATVTAEQRMAELREDHGVLLRSVDEIGGFTAAGLEFAETALRCVDGLRRAEKVEPLARWFRNLIKEVYGAADRVGRNLVWRAVATAPAGFCHVRNTMLGTLFVDIQSGRPWEEIRAAWSRKMDPLHYQRPTVLRQGNVIQAERLVDQMGLDLGRRFARDADMSRRLWQTVPSFAPISVDKPGVFNALRKTAEGPRRNVTWTGFQEQILGTARSIKIRFRGMNYPFYAMVTSSNMDAPPIMRWDNLDHRNPFSWYVYQRGSQAAAWALSVDTWHDVQYVVESPAWWGNTHGHGLPEQMFLRVAGCYERVVTAGGSFFPEFIRDELRPIRGTIEAHSRTFQLPHPDRDSVCGVVVGKGSGDWEYDLLVDGARIVIVGW